MDGMLAIKVVKKNGELIVPDEPHAVINLGFKNYSSTLEELNKESGIYFLTNNHDYSWYLMDEHIMAIWTINNAHYIYHSGKLEAIWELKAERTAKLEHIYKQSHKRRTN